MYMQVNENTLLLTLVTEAGSTTRNHNSVSNKLLADAAVQLIGNFHLFWNGGCRKFGLVWFCDSHAGGGEMRVKWWLLQGVSISYRSTLRITTRPVLSSIAPGTLVEMTGVRCWEGMLVEWLSRTLLNDGSCEEINHQLTSYMLTPVTSYCGD